MTPNDATVQAVYHEAQEAWAAGLSFAPPAEDGSKRPWPDDTGRWEHYRDTRRPMPDELKVWYPGRTGIGVFAGPISGHVECWDFDDHPVYDAFLEAAEASGLFAIVERIEDGYKDETPSGGMRWLVHYPADVTRQSNQKLARRPKRGDELKAGETAGVKTLIELPDHAIVAPTNGRVHPTERPYVRVSGGFATISRYTADERDALIRLARTFDAMPRAESRPTSEPRAATDTDGHRPGDEFNQRATWAEVLEPHGWAVVYTRGEVTCWRRPGKQGPGISATTNHAGSGLLYVFSSSTPFEPDRGYSMFSAYALLNHGGDFAAAARTLAAEGYSEPTRDADPNADTRPPDSPPSTDASREGLPVDALTDGVDVALEGQRIEDHGIPYAVPGILPLLGILGFIVAFAKVGKTTFALALAAAIAMGRAFLERQTTRLRVLVIAAEDPPEYVAWVSRHLDVERGWITFYRAPILLSADGLAQIVATVKAGGYGLVLIASWQAVIRGLVKDENDNAGAVCAVESVKAAARETGVPWLIDAHSGKGEDQTDDADPSRAMRGASSAAAAADFTLSLRYANGAFGTQRRLSGRGRFVNLEPTVIDFDVTTSTYRVLATNGKDVAAETTWRLICEVGALTTEPRSAGAIAKAIGMVGQNGEPSTTHKRQVAKALTSRPEVLKSEEARRGGKAVLYRLAPEVPNA
jgi:hypothetical protein